MTIWIWCISGGSNLTALPTWVREIFINRLAPLLGMSNVSPTDTSDTSELLSKPSLFDAKYARIISRICANHSPYPRECKTILSGILGKIRVITESIRNQAHAEEIEEEWKLLGKILDRLFFLVFLFTVSVSGIGILLPTYLSRDMHSDGTVTAHNWICYLLIIQNFRDRIQDEESRIENQELNLYFRRKWILRSSLVDNCSILVFFPAVPVKEDIILNFSSVSKEWASDL